MSTLLFQILFMGLQKNISLCCNITSNILEKSDFCTFKLKYLEMLSHHSNSDIRFGFSPSKSFGILLLSFWVCGLVKFCRPLLFVLQINIVTLTDGFYMESKYFEMLSVYVFEHYFVESCNDSAYFSAASKVDI